MSIELFPEPVSEPIPETNTPESNTRTFPSIIIRFLKITIEASGIEGIIVASGVTIGIIVIFYSYAQFKWGKYRRKE